MAYAAANGYATRVTVNHPPLSGNSTGSMTAIEVIISEDVPKFFIQAVYSGDWTATARSVSTLTSTQSAFGVITLDSHQCSSLEMDSNANASGTVGGFQGQSNHHVNPDPPNTGATAQPDPFVSAPTPPVGVGSDETPADCEFDGNSHYEFNPVSTTAASSSSRT